MRGSLSAALLGLAYASVASGCARAQPVGEEERAPTSASATASSTATGTAVAVAGVSATSASSAAVSARHRERRAPPNGSAPELCEPSGEPKPSALRVHGADAHAAMRFFAALYRESVIVAGEAADPSGDVCPGPCVDLDLVASGLEEAARTSGLQLTRRRSLVLVGPKAPASATPRLPTGPAIDLDLYRGSSLEVGQLLGDVMRREVRGVPQAQLTIAVREAPAADVLAAIADLLGAPASVGADGAIVLGGAAASAADAPPRRCPRDPLRGQVLDCIERGDLELLAVGRRGNAPAIAMLGGRLRGGARVAPEIVKAGDEVGAPVVARRADGDHAEHAKITRITCAGVEFDTGAIVSW